MSWFTQAVSRMAAHAVANHQSRITNHALEPCAAHKSQVTSHGVAMSLLITKYAITAFIIVVVSEVAKRSG